MRLDHLTLLGLLQVCAVATNDASDIRAAAGTCLGEICRLTGWPVGHLYLVAPDGHTLEPSGVWSVADPERFAPFQQVTNQLVLKTGEGLPGRVLRSGRPHWIVDSQRDPDFPRRAVATRVGVHAGLAFPILSGSAVTGVLEFFAPELVPPDEFSLEILAHIGRQLGRVVGRQGAAAKMRESELRFRWVAESAVDAIILADETGAITSWNPAACRMFGYTEEAMIGRALTQLMPERFRPGHLASISRLRRGESSGVDGRPVELIGLHSDGHEFPIELALSTWDANHQRLSSAIVRDISERKAAERSARAHDEGLRQSAEMEAVGQLAGGIAHDFNNVLTAIYGSAYILSERLPADSPHVPYVTEIREAAERAAGMTRHLRAFGRRQARTVVAVDVNALIEKLQKMLSRLMPESIQIELLLRPDLPPISADYSQVEQVILNLVVNARDAMPNGGRLTIATSRGDFDDSSVGDHVGSSSCSRVQITVGDTGVGMDPETQARIFEPYFTTKGRHGTGLGLAIVYAIVKQSGGNVWVHSEPSHGSTFKVYLPISLDEVVAEPPLRRVSETAGSEVIMLVEDDPAIRRLTSTILRNHGYSVLEAGSVDEALRLDSTTVAQVALLITDIVLPGGNGRRLAEELREPHPAMKVLFVSGYTENVIVHEPVEEPGLAFLPKPFTPLDLVERVRRMLDSAEPGAELA